MPLRIHVVEVAELYRILKEFWSKGYRCEADEDGNWECTKPINELLADRHIIILG
jgi:hypothetical protein